MRPVRLVYVYFRLMSQHLKSILEYQADFLITLVAALLTQLLGFVFLWVVYQRIPEINGWSFWEVAFIYATIFFTEGFSSLFFNGMWHLGTLVNRGGLDRYLVRPMPAALQVLTTEFGIGGVGNLVLGGIIIFQALQHIQTEWTLSKIVIAAVLIFSGMVIRVSVIFAACCQVFWTGSSNTSFPHMVHTLSDFAKYPITIYNLGVQALVTVIVPYAFISFFPASYIIGKADWAVWGLLSPLVAIYTAAAALWIFRTGIRRYESSGN
ncbi:ABC transporter permease [Paenibacillus thermotolerans]|uniref:ABC transporter permease n=1 Tax=Paenibacillus thermotolerans TaxID=3027807 RepID=UPI00236822FC|nr:MULTISPECIES: ABC-2 family transporter protein [unclassified Paenibacillus]